MAYQVISQNNTTTTLADENGNIIRVPARVSLATSTDYTIKKVNNSTATLEDGNGNIIRDVPCVAVLFGGEGGGGGAVSSVNGQTGDVVITGNDVLPDQTGQSGKFLTTDGTDASWATISALQNTATGTSSLTLLGTATTNGYAINIGDGSSVASNTSVVIGCQAENKSSSVGSVLVGYGAANYAASNSYGVGIGTQTKAGGSSVSIGWKAETRNQAVAIGDSSRATSTDCVAIGRNAQATAQYAVQLNVGTNSESDTLKYRNSAGNHTIISADGTIPTARLTKVNTTITLTAAGWSSNTQTVSVTGMTATGVVMVSPAPADQSAYTSAGILCTAQAAGTLTFTCDTVPSGDLSVNIVML